MNTSISIPVPESSARYIDISGLSYVSKKVVRTRKPTDSFWRASQPTIWLVGKIADGWIAISPIVITVEYGADGYVVSDDQFAMYGYGPTPSHAIDDYIQSLIEYYELLSERATDDQANNGLFRHLQNSLKPLHPE